MAAYQVPQFLDSGDKILGPLNLRQFGYALGGFLISALIFTLMNNAYPGIGIYGVLPATPLIALSSYAALGRFNGRDADFYIIRFVLYNIKPKFLKYSRSPDYADIEAKMAQFTPKKIEERWQKRLDSQKQLTKGGASFSTLGGAAKAKKVKSLGQAVDVNVVNSLISVSQTQMEINKRKEMLAKLQQTGNSNLAVSLNNAPENDDFGFTSIRKPQMMAENFFKVEDKIVER